MLVDSTPVAMSLHIHDDCVIPSSTCVQGNSTTAFVALSCTKVVGSVSACFRNK